MKCLWRYWPVIAGFHAGMLAMALHFGAVVLLGGSPIGADLYGPVVHAVPALVWVAIQASGSLMAMVGAILRNKIGGAMLLVGSVIVAILYGFFAAAASMAAQGVLLHAGSIYLCVPGALFSATAAIGELRKSEPRV